MLGVYGYFDKKDNAVIYVGKDSHIEKCRRNILDSSSLA